MLLVWLLVTRACAEWVEISQLHYHKPIRPGEPSRVFQQNPQKDLEYKHVKHQDDYGKPPQDYAAKDKTNPFIDREVKPANPFLRDSYHNPAVTPLEADPHIDREVKPVRVNPFLQDDYTSTKTDLEHFPRNPTRIRQVEGPQETYSNQTLTEYKWNLHEHRLNNRPEKNKPQVTSIPTYDSWNDNTYGLNDGGKNEEITHKSDVFNVRNKSDPIPGKIERVSNIGTVKRVDLSNTPVKSPTINKMPANNLNRRNNNPFVTQNYDNRDDELEVKTKLFDSHEHSFANKHTDYKLNSEEVLIEEDNRRSKNPFDDNKGAIPKGQIRKINKPEAEDFPFKSSAPDDIETTHEENKINFINSNKPHEFPVIRDTLEGFVNANNKSSETVLEDGKNNFASDQNKNGKSNKKDSSSGKEEDTSSSGEIKTNTMENILKFMKIVAETITKNTRRGAGGKIAYLNELKHSLLDNIKSRIDAAWPDEDSAGARRHSRSASPRGHVEFPSSESALMTISFLTFAVFLIKLVLQVIQTYKHKTMVMAPLVVATAGRTIASKLRGKNNVDRL